MAEAETHTMTCMEVWGGNTLVDNSVSMAGLDAWVYSKPYESADAGGDVHYVSSCATGRITRLLVADVSGHGAQVRDIAIELRGLMRRYVNHLDQRSFVRSMNKQFTQLSQASCFATAVVLTFFGPTNYLTLCNAGHPTPLLYRAKEKRWMLLERSDDSSSSSEIVNIPLGIDDITDYEQAAVQLEAGDLVLCYSDSLIESFESPGEMLGEKGLLAVANQIDVTEPAKVIPRLLGAIESRVPGNLSGDDVTALLFRATGPARSKFRHRLVAPFRVVGGLIGSFLPGGQRAPLPDFTLANLGGALIGKLDRRWTGKKK
jgi:serine phosphatase RsbU (regulator of sigma subunit)